ncbi:MAG: Fur family transcriptional regulator [Spirochaetes bacterium]|nr:Fur family transcriptional regulator [Spirochaetota bacterium]
MTRHPTNAPRTTAEIDRALRDRGITATRQRRLLARILLSQAGHIAAEELHARARSTDPRIGLATVYRTLGLFKSRGLVAERDFGDGWRRYEGGGAAHHDHLVCLGCGKVVEFDVPEIESLQEKVAGEHGFDTVSHRMELYGYCAACRRRRRGEER